MANFGNALSGAGVGAGIGSAFGPIGAGIGGLLGGVSGLFGFGKGKEEKIKQNPILNPQQIDLLGDLISQAKMGNQNALGYLNQILSNDPEAISAFQQPAMQEFEEDIIPSILERFSGLGARSSSALNQTLGRAATNLETNLNAQRSQLKSNAINQLMGYSQMGLTPTTSPYIKGGAPGAFEMLAPTAGKAFGSFLNSKLGA